MRARSIGFPRRALVPTVLALLGWWPTTQAAPGPARPAVLPIRVWEAGGASVDRPAVREATLALLAASGVPIAWRDCGTPDPCEQAAPRSGVTLILTPAPRRDCGTTALEPDMAAATVLLSLPCVEDVVARLRRSGTNRADPRLASLRTEHVLAAAIAHELGHAMGLEHAGRGLMRSRLGVEEILALRQGQLTFSPREAMRMRASRLWAETMVARDR